MNEKDQIIVNSMIKQFAYYESLGKTTIERLEFDQLCSQPNESSNSIEIIVNHLNGNMMSRWTDFLSTDGEKDFRQRDKEFLTKYTSKTDLLLDWDKGWGCLFKSLESLSDQDLQKLVYIRNQGHTVMEAIHRQLCHYAYHVGQIVYLGRMFLDKDWQSLTIPKGKSEAYNSDKFSKDKRTIHFTDDL